MSNARDLVVIVAWIAVVAYLAVQTTRKPRSAARTGPRGRRLRARPGSGGMSVRFTPPPRYLPDVITVTELPRDELATALAGLTPALLCTLCVIELKQARAAGQPDPEIHPGVVIGEVVIDGRASIAVLCEVRHQLAAVAVPGPAAALHTPDLSGRSLT
jgi:hypothetical protein